HPPGQYLPGQTPDLRRGTTERLVETPALQSPDLGEEQRVDALTRLQVDGSVKQGRGHRPTDLRLGRLDERVEPFFQRAEPGAVIDEVGPLLIDPGLEIELFLRQAKLLEVVMELEQHRRRGRLIELPRLEPHDPVFEDVDLADAVAAGDHVEL